MTTVKPDENIFDALGFDSEEAENLRIRSQLMMNIDQYIEKHQLKQKEAAELFGTTQARISNIKNGKIDQFTIDVLVNMLAKAKKRVELSISDAA